MSDGSIDIEHFIIQVKQRPVLWNPNHEFYNQRHSKLAAWEEVSANLYEDWADLSNYDKFPRVRDIQNRWRNIRDSYTRELKYEKKVQKGMAMPKKKYKYSHLLEFLKLGTKAKDKSDQSSTDIEESPMKKEENKQITIYLSDLKHESDSFNEKSDQKNNQVRVNGNKRVKRFKSNNDSTFNVQSDSSTMDSDYNNQTPEIEAKKEKLCVQKTSTPQSNSAIEADRSRNYPFKNNEPSSQEYYQVNSEYLTPSVEIHTPSSAHQFEQDDDRMFVLSLIPYFKKLNEERRLQARIEMSKLLHTMIYKKH